MLQNSVSKNCQMPELGYPVQPEELELCPPPCLIQLSVCVDQALLASFSILQVFSSIFNQGVPTSAGWLLS